MTLSNTFLIRFVWSTAVVGLVLLSAAIASAQPPDSPIYSMRGWDDSGSVYMWFDVAFRPDGSSFGGNIWLMDADRIPIGTDPLLRIDQDMIFDFDTMTATYSSPFGSFDGGVNDAFVVHNAEALALDYTNTLTAQWLVPEASACVLFLLGIACVALGRRR